MIRVLETVMPVLVMLILGMLCRTGKVLEKKSVENLKRLVTQIILPAAIFHALGTAEYSGQSVILVAIMLVMLLISFGIGFLLRPLMNREYRKYIPFMVSVYEGGMIAYPLYAGLCGSENLSRIAMLDIAGLLFGFSIYMGLLNQTEKKNGFHVAVLAKDALTSPAFLASVAGLLVGTTGVLSQLIQSAVGGIYLNMEDILTKSLSPLILIVVGYEMQPDLTMLKPCVKTIVMRALLQAVMIAGVLTVVHHLAGREVLLDMAVITYMSAPATFSMQSFLKDEKAGRYASATNSLYCIVSIAVYIVLAAVYR